MNERFLIPSAVALALHAFVFLAFGRGHPAVRGFDPPAVVADPAMLIPIDLAPPPSDDAPASAASGQRDVTPPDLPELPPRDTITDIALPREVRTPSPAVTDSRIIPGPIGDPNVMGGLGAGLGPISSAHLDNPPRTRTQLAPVYPYEARKDGRPGEVVVEFVVDENGRVLEPHVLHSNDPLFDEPTLRAVAKWRFEPGRKNGRVVRFRMAVPVSYAVNP